MLIYENYKMFKGTMTIKPITPKGYPQIESFDVTGTWLYKPEYTCWYCNGSSYPEDICVVSKDETI